MSFLSTMAVTLPERHLLVKLFYENKGNAAAALRKFRLIKNLRKGQLRPQALKRMITRCEKTGDHRFQPGRGRKPTRSDMIEDVATAIFQQAIDNVAGYSFARAVSRILSIPYCTVENILKKMVFFFSYKICYNQQLLPIDWEIFALTFLARVEVDASGPGHILRNDEAHFH